MQCLGAVFEFGRVVKREGRLSRRRRWLTFVLRRCGVDTDWAVEVQTNTQASDFLDIDPATFEVWSAYNQVIRGRLICHFDRGLISLYTRSHCVVPSKRARTGSCDDFSRIFGSVIDHRERRQRRRLIGRRSCVMAVRVPAGLEPRTRFEIVVFPVLSCDF